MEVLLNALTSLGLLVKKGSQFRAEKNVAELFKLGSRHDSTGVFLHAANFWGNWSCLTEAVRSGRPPEVEWTAKKRRDLAMAMEKLSRISAGRLASMLDLSSTDTMLDLGGGPGEYAIAFVRRHPHLRATVFDRDDVALATAAREIERQKLENRVTVEKGDLFADDFGKEYDLALLSSLICLFVPKEIDFLLRKTKDALRKGGQLVIVDSMTDESKTQPPSAAIFAVKMLVETQRGEVYAASKVEGFLRECGLERISRMPLDDSQAVVGFKQH
jgi:SAM-dependent methyltransferase